MADIKYKYAYDVNKKLVGIEEVSKETRNDCRFYCISCGAELIAKLGEINEHHFAHKKGCDSCNSETYLHRLAKKLIKGKFDNSNTFNVVLCEKKYCSKKDRCLMNSEDCFKREYETFDLRKFYNTCQEEAEIGDYCADLLLSDCTGKYKEPILIEICVTHKCSDEKIRSGYRIIEVPIKSEEDINNYVRNSTWYHNNELKYFNFYAKHRSVIERNFTRVILKKNGYLKIRRNVSCATKKERDSIVEFNIYSNSNYSQENVVSGLVKLGYSVNSCTLCKNYTDGYGNCKLAYKYGTPYKPKWTVGNYCKHYCADKAKIEELNTFPSVKFYPVE